jgi:hypothetical protein
MAPKTQLSQLELERIAPIKEAAELRGVSQDTLERTDPDKIIEISPKRRGMRVRDALMIGADT